MALAGHTNARRARNVMATSMTAQVRMAARICGTVTWKRSVDLPEDVDRDDHGGHVQARVAEARQGDGVGGPAECDGAGAHVGVVPTPSASATRLM